MTGDELRDATAGLRPFVLGLAGIAIVVLGGWALVRSSSSPDVAQIQIEGPFQQVSAGDVRAALEPLLDEDFLALNLDEARARVAELPWVARSRVERVWPGTLRVRVWEREVFARWNGDSLLDIEAQVFTPDAADLAPALPQLGGAPGHEREVMDTFQRIGARLQSTPFALASLRQDARGEWTAQTHAGIELRFGRGQPDEKLPMLLGAVVHKLGAELPQAAHIDLRYTNGFAVGWRSQPTHSGESKKNG